MIKQALLALGFIAVYLVFVSPPAEVLNYENYQPADDFSAYIKPDRFKDIKVIKSSELEFPEDVDIDQETGDVYTGNSKGIIFKISPNESIEKVVQGKGHILRIQLDKANNQIFFVDSRQGICKANLITKQITILVRFQKYGAFNSFDISKDGIIYFTETSSKFSLEQASLAILSARPDGNVYRYDPKTNQTTLILDKLYCPNGIQVSPDGQYLYISQMGRYRVIRFNLHNKNVQTVIQNLEAGPDNLRFNDKGQLWIGLPVYRDTFQDFLIQSRWLRNTLSKLSSSLIMKFVKSSYVGAMKINTKGQVLDYIKESADKYQFLSTAMEYKNHLYLASFKYSAIAKVPIQSSSAVNSGSNSEELQL